ncbi:MAG TPA: class I SAM-dependent methyltransferase, partial [Bacteroidia bacterium]|nr:class I SAM-dependent methyltransferase [Bacteroidia bacterium]
GISSVLEIGGGDGFILRYLKTQGVKRLVNIEPSLPESYESEGISYLKKFASESVDLGTSFDLVLSIGVFEHIEKINDVLRFCKKHLSPGGRLLFSVPNSDGCLRSGDPSLFLHQHIHYYTESSLKNLLAVHGFSVIHVDANYDSLIVSAVMDAAVKENADPRVVYDSYSTYLDRVIKNVQTLLTQSPGKTIVHGANGALNNLLGWMGGTYDYTLVDNDETKHGKTYFGKKVHAMKELKFPDYAQVVIIPQAFLTEIKSAYENAGFKGKISGILD